MSTIKEDLAEIKEIEDTIIANKVANFAYTDEAYTTNDANGVTEFNINKAQNIPTAEPSVLKVNDTVLSQGYRTQASSITRMLMNHFLGRLSYNVNKVNDNFNSLLVKLDEKLGTANGIATLDTNGRVPYSQLPTDVIFDNIYPIGSIYISVGNVKPAFGEWEKLATGKTLWNDNTSDGREIEAGLPNITGELEQQDNRAGIRFFRGAFYGTGETRYAAMEPEDSSYQYKIPHHGYFNARNGETDINGNIKTSGQVFGNSNTVQPPAIAVSMWKRTA